jgi:hypothetical protein
MTVRMTSEVAEGGATCAGREGAREFSYSWETTLNSEGWKRQEIAGDRTGTPENPANPAYTLTCDFAGLLRMT